jgi:catechol 2,3-dioxygenase-like lactoylglutathione lyase family enzyme
MSLLTTTGLHHVRITVTDLARSRKFYEDVLGFEVAAESSGDPSDPAVRTDPFQLFGGVVFATHGILFGLRPVADPGDTFESTRVGLEEAGVDHGEVVEMPEFGIAILSFSDPDGVHLELTSPIA